jgi:hypothetical protein
MTNNRTILLVGRTGNGKSTIANVISNTGKFKESEYGVSETTGIDEGYFRVRSEDTTYHIVDTIGIGDTRFDEKEVLNRLADASNAVKNGLNQILFVTSGRFTEEEIKAYNLLRTVFFADNIGDYTTVVRTKFPSFRNPEKCRKDKEMMMSQNEDVGAILRSCRRLIHVNNLTEEEDPELKARAECRTILRRYLKHNCHDVYRPKNLDEMNDRIRDHMTEKERIRKEMDDLKGKLRESEERANKGDEQARKMYEEYKKAFDNLSEQQTAREEKIAKIMAEQMNSKLSEIKEGYNSLISNLKEQTEYLVDKLNEERSEYRISVNRQQEIYEACIEDLRNRKPEVHHHHHGPSCEIM